MSRKLDKNRMLKFCSTACNNFAKYSLKYFKNLLKNSQNVFSIYLKFQKICKISVKFCLKFTKIGEIYPKFSQNFGIKFLLAKFLLNIQTKFPRHKLEKRSNQRNVIIFPKI